MGDYKNSASYRWKQRNPDKEIAYRKKRWQKEKKDPVWLKKHNRESTKRGVDLRIKRRIELLKILGGHCACKDKGCWCKGKCKINNLDVITFDHKKVEAKTDKVRLVQYPLHPERAREKLQPLCANCHIYKTRKNEEWNGNLHYG